MAFYALAALTGIEGVWLVLLALRLAELDRLLHRLYQLRSDGDGPPDR